MHYFAHLIRGTAKLCTADETLLFAEGDIFFLPKGIKYRSNWYPDKDGIVQFYSLGFDHLPYRDKVTYKLQLIECSSEEKMLLETLENDITVCPLSVGRLYTFLGTVEERMQTEIPSGREETIHKALEFMRHNNNYNICDVAHHCGVSESGLYATFRRHLGQTPVDVRHSILIEKASELLYTTDLPIEEISSRLGFSSSSYFRKVFRQQTGKTPTEIRKNANFV